MSFEFTLIVFGLVLVTGLPTAWFVWKTITDEHNLRG
jgi:hypothetical protein